MTKPTYVYLLVDPRDDEIRYVGISSCPSSRYLDHVNGNTNEGVIAWIDELRAEDTLPTMCIVHRVKNMKCALVVEKAVIKVARAFSSRALLN